MLLEYYVVWTLKEEKMHTAHSRFAKYSRAVHSASFHEYFENAKARNCFDKYSKAVHSASFHEYFENTKDFWLYEKKNYNVRDGKFEENHHKSI